MDEEHQNDFCNIGLAEGETEALLVALFGLIRLYPGRIFRIKGNASEDNLTIDVYANEDWPDYDPKLLILKSFKALDLMFTASRLEALAELNLDENHPVSPRSLKPMRISIRQPTKRPPNAIALDLGFPGPRPSAILSFFEVVKGNHRWSLK